MNTPNGWSPAQHARRRPFLMARGHIKSAIRDWFVAAGFTETECGALQVSPGNEAHLHAFRTAFETDGGRSMPLYLQTSPEFAMKKLLAAGETRIFDFARAFRNRETGVRHAPEFTMLEWYRVGQGLDAVMGDTATVVRLAARAAGRDQLVFQGRQCDPHAAPRMISVAEAFDQLAGIDLDSLLDDADGLRAACRACGIGISDVASWSDIFSAVLVARIEPQLGDGPLTFLHTYPLSEAALARPLASDPRYAARFEAYACGVELANGYDELTDPGIARARQSAEMDLKQRLYGERYPLDEDFLAAMAQMPDASGVALGFDRLVMLVTGAPSIADVLWTPFGRLDEVAT